jgi:O-antigen ligase
MMLNPSAILLLLALAAMLLVAPFNPEVGNIAYLSISGLALLFALPKLASEWFRPIICMPLVAFALVAIAYGFGHGSIDGLIGLIYFAPILTILPLAVAARKVQSERWHLTWPLVFAMVGVFVALVMAAVEYIQTGTPRAGGYVANPIHYADVALLVGTITLYAIVLRQDRWRWVTLLTLVFGLVAVMLSGSRGAIIAAPIMLMVGYLAAGALNVFPRKLVGWSTVAAIVLGVVGVAVLGERIGGFQRILVDVENMMANGIPPGSLNYERVQMIIGGWGAFLERPIFGHGPLNFQGAAERFGDIPYAPVPHLHNDIIDFLASGGVVGLVAFVLLMLAPMAEAWRVRATAQGPALLAYALMMMSGFIVMGLTNAMFGILTLTNYYAIICVITAILAEKATREVSPARS